MKNQKIEIECSKEGIIINGNEIEFPIHLNDLIKLFGEPSRKEFDLFWRVIWDDLGIYTSYPTWDYIVNINFLSSHNHKLKHTPEKIFEGTIFVIAKEKFIQSVSFKKNQVKKLTFKGENEPYATSIGKNFSVTEKIPKTKYKFKPIKEEKIEFEDFGFKICIIQELMFKKKQIKPKFDLYEFVKCYDKRKIDLELEGYEPIEEITQYFKDLQISKKLANEITEIQQHADNEIYLQLICFPEGDEDYWDIKTANDARHFPNLKKVVLCYANSDIIEDLKKLGIDAKKN